MKTIFNFNKAQWSWALYDWANSAFATTIMAGFFPVYFKSFLSQGADPTHSTQKLGVALTVGGVILAVINPFLGVLSDFGQLKKKLTLLFMLIGVFFCLALSTVNAGDWLNGLLIYTFAYVAFTASTSFYDSLLNSVSNEANSHQVSALGYSLGYIGGGLLFLVNVLMYLKPEIFGIESGIKAVQISFVTVGFWWMIFSLPLLLFVKEESGRTKNNSFLKLLSLSLNELKNTYFEIKNQKNIFLFMIAFWFYIDGVYTVITMAVDYGLSIGLESKHLIAALLITQFVGFPTSLAFGWIAHKWGSKIPLLFCLIVYSGVVVFATQMTQEIHFYILAATIGSVQGGVQALSRSLFSKMIPVGRSGEYFGLLNMVGKFASILGPLIVTMTVFFTNDSRLGLLGLLILFIAGALLLSQIKES